jgi:hypothetical protein
MGGAADVAVGTDETLVETVRSSWAGPIPGRSIKGTARCPAARFSIKDPSSGVRLGHNIFTETTTAHPRKTK